MSNSSSFFYYYLKITATNLIHHKSEVEKLSNLAQELGSEEPDLQITLTQSTDQIAALISRTDKGIQLLQVKLNLIIIY